MAQGMVSYKIGLTINIPEYQSARIDIGIDLPFDEGERDKKYEEAREYVNEKLIEEMDTLQALKSVLKGMK